MNDKREIRSNIKKLWRHLPYILDIKYRTRPISLSLHVTNNCNLNCDFCYIKNIDRTQELDYDKLINFISIIKPKSVQLTGGEPCIYPHINKLIKFLNSNNIKIGMFTNGNYIRIINHLQYFNWLRVSINPYIDNNVEFKDPPKPKSLGYIYIKHKGSPHTEELEEKLKKFMDNHRGSYLKVVQDILEPTQIDIKNDPERKIIIQKPALYKPYKGICYMGYLKPYLNGDGLVYPCISTVNLKTKIRDKSKAITDIDHPYDLLTYHDIIMDCKYCRFWDRNKFISYINEKEIEDEDFL